MFLLYDCVFSRLLLTNYDFYSFSRLNNVSWLQPMCEYHQNLYPRMNTGKNKNQRALLLPGAWGSTSGPRGGYAQFFKPCHLCPGPQCNLTIDLHCTSDPFSCSNIALNKTEPDGPGTLNQSGLVWEVEDVLTHLGGRECFGSTCPGLF